MVTPKTTFSPEDIVRLLTKLAEEYEAKLEKAQSEVECLEEELTHLNESIHELSFVAQGNS